MIKLSQAKRIGDKLGVDWNKVDLNEFKMGMNVELEHRNVTKSNLTLTGMIARSHLREMPDYYTKLKRMERGG